MIAPGPDFLAVLGAAVAQSRRHGGLFAASLPAGRDVAVATAVVAVVAGSWYAVVAVSGSATQALRTRSRTVETVSGLLLVASGLLMAVR